MTELDKFRNFFNEINIKYTESEYIPLNKPVVIVLSIDEKHFNPFQYSASLDFRFDKRSGKLIFIEPYGE